MFFLILIKLNFIPILICWKKILYLENFSQLRNLLSQLRINSLLFSWDLLPHTHTTYFSTTISAVIVINIIKYSMHFIIHNSYGWQLNDVTTKYSIISTEKNVKLSYLVGSIDKNNVYFHMTFLLPKYWKLQPLSRTFIDHAVKHGFILHTIWTHMIRLKTLLGNKLNDFYLDTLWFLWNVSLTETVLFD